MMCELSRIHPTPLFMSKSDTTLKLGVIYDYIVFISDRVVEEVSAQNNFSGSGGNIQFMYLSISTFLKMLLVKLLVSAGFNRMAPYHTLQMTQLIY